MFWFENADQVSGSTSSIDRYLAVSWYPHEIYFNILSFGVVQHIIMNMIGDGAVGSFTFNGERLPSLYKQETSNNEL